MIENKITELRAIIPPGKQALNYIDVREFLSTLLHKDCWSNSDLGTLCTLSHKADISRQIQTHYRSDWKKSEGASPLTEPWLSIITLLLYKLFVQEKSLGAKPWQLLKRINTLKKILDKTSESWLSDGSSISNLIEESFHNLRAKIPFKNIDTWLSADRSSPIPSNLKTKIPLTILYWEGPIARAYLETIHSLGFTPEKIIYLISSLDVDTKKPISRWAPKTLREKYAANLQQAKMNYWPKKIIKDSFPLYREITDKVHTTLNFRSSTLSGAHEIKNLDFYCEDVETVFIENLRDPILRERLAGLSKKSFLYTGGGLLPENLLSMPQHRFIHIHPGFLPNIRGADCTLWSSLIAGRTSATCFYMAPTIDTGDIIFPCWLPKVQFDISIENFDLKTLYRAIYGFFDPWVRSYVLRHMVEKNKRFDNIPAIEQDYSEGMMYHFMHTSIQKCAFQNLFTGASTTHQNHN